VTSPERVAESAQVSVATLLRHFPTKHDILQELIRELRQATLNRWFAETAQLPDPLAKLHAIADSYLQAIRNQAAEFGIMHRALLEGGADEVLGVRTYYSEFEALLAQVIGEGQQSGVFRRDLDPRVGAWELIHSALGQTLTAPLGMPLHQEEDYLTRAVDCLFHALLKVDV